jgi:cell division control protein 6
MIIILDEVDHLMRKSGDALIYRLLRIDEEYGSSGTLSLILISQEQILDMFESAVISRFGYLNHLRLDGYDEEGLFKIAHQRAEMAFMPDAISKSMLRLIAEAAAPSGDARVVIDLLTNSSRLAEKDGRSEILSSDVQRLSMERPGDSNDSVVDELAAHAMLLLIAICRRLKNASEISSGDAVSLYKVVCEEYEQSPRGHTTLWKHLKKFEEGDLLKVRAGVVSEGRGRTQHFSMPHLLPVDIEKRLEALVKAKLRK